METIGSVWMWAGSRPSCGHAGARPGACFTGRRTRSVSGEALTWSGAGSRSPLTFNALIWSWYGPTKGSIPDGLPDREGTCRWTTSSYFLVIFS